MADLEFSAALGGWVPFGTTGTAVSTVAVQSGDALFVRQSGTITLTTGLPAASLSIGGLGGQSPLVILPEGAVLGAGVVVLSGGRLQLGQNVAHPNALNPARLTGDLTVAAGGQVQVVDGRMEGLIAPTGTILVRNNATIGASGSLSLASLEQPLPILADAAGTLTIAAALDTATLLAIATNADKSFNPLFNGHLAFSGTLDNSGTLLPLGSLGLLSLDGATILGGAIGGATHLSGAHLVGVDVSGSLATIAGDSNSITGRIGGFGLLAVDGTLGLSASVTLAATTLSIGDGGTLLGAGPISLAVGTDSALTFAGGATLDFTAGATVNLDGTLDLTGPAPAVVAWNAPTGALTIGAGAHVHLGGGATLRLDTGFTPGAPIAVDGGTLELKQAGNVGTIGFSSLGGALLLGTTGATGTLADFADGMSLFFAGAADIGASLHLNAGTLEVFSSGGTLDGAFVLIRNDGGTYTEGNFNLGIVGDALALTTSGVAITACFAAGTLIETEEGEQPVETLRPGDMVRTAFGDLAAIAWTGRRALDLSRHPRPWDVAPVRVLRDAFGPGLPRRDLVLSPDHALLVEGVLIPVRYLMNGATIRQEAAGRITYHHIELARHDAILAEGMPAETYLDTGNRHAFEGEAAVLLHADFAPPDPEAALAIWRARACAPLAVAGPELACVRRALAVQAEALGFRRTHDPALAQRRVPGGVWLESRSMVPAEADLGADHRRLGVAVAALRVDGRPLARDDARLGPGWHDPEPDWRWTDGLAFVAVSDNETLEVELATVGVCYLIPPGGHVDRQRGRAAS